MAPKPMKEHAHWTTEDEKILLAFLIEHKSEGDSGGFKKATWTAAAIEVNKNLSKGGLKTGDAYKAKFQALKATHGVVNAIQENSGWSWDDKNGADITPEKKGIWDDYIAKHPTAHPFCNAGWVHLDAFNSLGSSSAKGGHVFQASQGLSAADINKGFLNAPGTLDDESDDVDGS